MSEYIYFEDSWNIYERGTGSTGTPSDDTKRPRGPEKIYEKK